MIVSGPHWWSVGAIGGITTAHLRQQKREGALHQVFKYQQAYQKYRRRKP